MSRNVLIIATAGVVLASGLLLLSWGWSRSDELRSAGVPESAIRPARDEQSREEGSTRAGGAEAEPDRERIVVPAGGAIEDPPIAPTLQESLVRRYAEKKWGDYSRVTDPLSTVDGAMQAHAEYVRGRALSAGDRERLERLVADNLEVVKACYEREWMLRKEALANAVIRGNYVARDSFPVTSLSPDAMRVHRERSEEAFKKVMESIGSRLGLPKEDWRYNIANTSQPDGVSRQVVTFFSKFDAPAFFEAEKEHLAAKRLRDQSLKEFFSRLP